MRIRERKKIGSGMEKIQIRDKHPGSATLITKRHEDGYRTDRLSISYLRGTVAGLSSLVRICKSCKEPRTPSISRLETRNRFLGIDSWAP
jgi:hypothetical protein